MKDIPRIWATHLLTGPAGRFAAFVIDVSAASARWYAARRRGEEMTW